MLDFLIPSERGNSPVGKSPTFRAKTGKEELVLEIEEQDWIILPKQVRILILPVNQESEIQQPLQPDNSFGTPPAERAGDVPTARIKTKTVIWQASCRKEEARSSPNDCTLQRRGRSCRLSECSTY